MRFLYALLPLVLGALLPSVAIASVPKVEEQCEEKGGVLVDKATGIKFEFQHAFTFDSAQRYALLGAGPRRKNLYVTMVNVYSVGLYVDATVQASLKSRYKGRDANTLAQDAAYYSSLVEAKGGKALYLKFARAVGAAKVVDALTAVQGVPAPVMKDFHDAMLKAIGGQIGKGETVTLGWSGEKVSVEVRDKAVITLQSKELGTALFNLFLGPQPVSAEAKAAFAARTPALLAHRHQGRGRGS